MKRFITKSIIKTTSLLFIVTTLSACGFHLRGVSLVPEDLAQVSLTSFDQYGQLTRNIDAQLRLHNIKVVPPSETVPNIHLIREGVGERTLSLYQNSRAAEKGLTYSASFRVTIPNVGEKTYSTTVTRNYLDNPRTALAKSVERDMIKDEMREQAAIHIMRQLARLQAEIDNDEATLEPDTELQDKVNSPSEVTVTEEVISQNAIEQDSSDVTIEEQSKP